MFDKFLKRLLALSSLLIVAACGSDQPGSSAEGEEDGETLVFSAIEGLNFYVEEGCATCHCNDAGGGCNLAAPNIQTSSPELILSVLTAPGSGQGAVSHPFKFIDPPSMETLVDLSRFLGTLGQRERDPGSINFGSSQLGRGFELYNQAGCVVCHLSSAQGSAQGGIGVPIAGTDPDNVYSALTGMASPCHPIQLNPPDPVPAACARLGISTNPFVEQLVNQPLGELDPERTFLAYFLYWIAPPPIAGTDPCDNEPGSICTYAGLGFGAFTVDGVEASQTSVYSPLEVEGTDWNDDGQIDIGMVDWNNHRIRIIYENATLDDGTVGNRIESLAGTGKVTGDDALNHMTDIAFDPIDGALTMANWHNQNMYRYHKGVPGPDRDQIAGVCDLACPDDSVPTRAGDTLLGLPYSLAIHPDGKRMWFSEGACSRIRLMTLQDAPPTGKSQPDQCITPVNLWNDNMIETIAGAADGFDKGDNGYAGDDTGIAKDARFNISNSPVVPNFGLDLAPDNRTLYVADWGNNVIRAIDVEAEIPTIQLIAGNPNSAGRDDGPALGGATFNHPTNLYATPDGAAVYITDAGNHLIRRYDVATGMVTTVAGNGRGAFTGDNMPVLESSLNVPGGVWVHPDGRIFIADTNNHRVRVVCPEAGCPPISDVPISAPPRPTP